MRENSFYFCVDIPYENTSITEYDTLKDLIKENELYMKKNDDWYILEGKEVYYER